MLVVHFFVNGKKAFLAPADLNFHASFCEGGLQLGLHFSDQITPATPGLGHRFGQDLIAPRLEMAKRQFLQFAVSLVQTQAVCNGCVNL